MGRFLLLSPLLLLPLLLVSGCGAEIVATRRRIKGPVAAVGWIDPGGGEVKYSLSGPAFMVRRRRRDAMEKMADFCGGSEKVKVVDEVDRSENPASYTSEGVEETVISGERHYLHEQTHHIFFECRPEGKKGVQ